MNPTSETMNAASSDEATGWHQIDWEKAYRSVRKTQLKIAQATKAGDWRRVFRLQRLLAHSFYGRCMAVKRVTENRGRKTPGVDGETWSTPTAKWNAVKRLSHKRGYQPRPLKRVWIPKPGKQEKRPLGIPTMLDRAMQALYLQGLEPVVESTSDPKSYGFRPDRSTTDAMVELFHLLAPSVAPVWILEGDIKGFFDNINHEWLRRNVPMDKAMLHKWLKAGVIDKCQFAETKAGTPQGGIISPCLANATLNGLEFQLKAHFVQKVGVTKSKRLGLQVVRYADDFVITAYSKELLENEVKPWVEEFLSVRGVQLSREKTRITHINTGFDFLGWNFRKYVPKSPYRKAKLFIKPSKKNAQAFYQKVAAIINNSGALTQDALIGQLNPVLRGWAEYHSPVVAKQTFSKLEHLIFWRLWRWAKHRHPNKSIEWIRKRYFKSINGQKWVFALAYKLQSGETRYRRLYGLASTPIVRHKRLPADYNPYDAEHEEKWEALRVQRMRHKLRYRKEVWSLFARQLGLCAFCGGGISMQSGWHDHHIVRRVDGGSDRKDNRALLHPNCHALVHSQGSTKELQYSGLGV
ncbi:group II intron reverse transcriptase/maturase [Cellvibrio sp. QJXJ]|uniref:group II intron reverse transcriptase/maturase n=1 Tax=Cellvibrio sp. QJXJ TaxID=2964606 RepID=UPI0021C3D165|nr:group II intron reverse transcriptase/maturase [Cellvibrio sp. QJXJ]UUA74007.1 group II intron reverse transcriptase/maturase [Cellvibrio sp. QJXJ]